MADEADVIRNLSGESPRVVRGASPYFGGGAPQECLEIRSTALSRRGFLRRAGMLGAAAGAPALLAACSGAAVSEGGDGAASEPAGGASAVASPDSSAAAGGGDSLKIGLLIPTSGVYSLNGIPMRQGFQLYLEERPDGFGGRAIETVEADEGETPETGLRAAQRLLDEEQVDVVVGIVSSAVALGVRDLFHERQVPLIIANAGANALTQQAKSPYIFRTSFSNRAVDFSMGQWTYDNVAPEGVFLIAPDYAAGHEHLGGFREAYEAAGGQVSGEVLPPFAQTQDYQPFLSQIQNSGARATFAFFAGGEAVTFVQQYQQFGLAGAIPLLGTGFLVDENVLPAQGPAAEGIRTSMHYSQDLPNERNQQFVEGYEAAYGEAASLYAVQAYDAAQLLDLALEATGGESADVDALVEAMEGVGEIDSPRGAFTLDANHNPVQMYYLREVTDNANVYQQDLLVVEDPV